MSSQDCIAANRSNAGRSTGHASSTGKQRSSRNARKHGLSISIRHEPGMSNKIETLAVAIAGDNATPRRLQTAHEVAEAHFELQRLQIFKVGLIEKKRVKIEGTSLADNTSTIDDILPATPQYVEAFIEALPELFALERYERRAKSRSRRAFYEYAMACEQ